jgi:hypothetical protein
VQAGEEDAHHALDPLDGLLASLLHTEVLHTALGHGDDVVREATRQQSGVLVPALELDPQGQGATAGHEAPGDALDHHGRRGLLPLTPPLAQAEEVPAGQAADGGGRHGRAAPAPLRTGGRGAAAGEAGPGQALDQQGRRGAALLLLQAQLGGAQAGRACARQALEGDRGRRTAATLLLAQGRREQPGEVAPEHTL